MCVLCDVAVLRRLGAPFDSLAQQERADAIREARDAAAVISPELADAALRGNAPALDDPQLYDRHVLSTAQEEGVLTSSDAFRWRTALAGPNGLDDARVQAFLSSCAEYVASYLAGAADRRRILERYLEVHTHDVEFAGIGRDGEVWYENRGARYAVLTDEEAMEMAVMRITETLPSLTPEELLPYTRLPASALDVLEAIRTRPQDEAAEVLAGIVDVALMAEDRVSREGFGPLFVEEGEEAMEDSDFGDYVVLHLPAAEADGK